MTFIPIIPSLRPSLESVKCRTLHPDMLNQKNLNLNGTLGELFRASISSFKDNMLADYSDGGALLTYGEAGEKCFAMDAVLTQAGIYKGDRVAILAENMPMWIVAFFSTTAFGRVVVPILPDCSANEVNNILRHSQAKGIFASKKQMPKIDCENLEDLLMTIDIESLECKSLRECKTSQAGSGDCYVSPDDMAAIFYTSGTSGNAKGVMLSHRNIMHNIECAKHIQKTYVTDVWLSILPMGHTFELSLGMLLPFWTGAKIYYTRKSPTPAVLLKAFKAVRPTIMMSVPLIIEKVYRKSIVPELNKNWMIKLLRVIAPSIVYRKAGEKMLRRFGGRLRFFGIGAAKLDSEVESFLKAAKFPYAIGYGMTECAPLIAVANVGHTKVGSTGKPVYEMKIRLDNLNPKTGEGEIVVSGDNVMMGYYKDPERTKEAFTADGWLRTGDLASMDKDGNISIKGRRTNMILGASGENIYPEEIEMVLAGIDGVDESLVKSDKGKLVAIIKLNEFWTPGEDVAKRILSTANPMLNKASQLSRIEFLEGEFEKTSTRKIRRYLYN